MADKTIPELTPATTPLAAADLVPVSQSGGDAAKVSVGNLTAGRNVDGTSFTVTGSSAPANGVYLPAANTVGVAANSALNFQVLGTASAVNRIQVTGTTSSDPLPILATGTGTNIGINYITKGTGGHNFYMAGSDSNTVFAARSAGANTNAYFDAVAGSGATQPKLRVAGNGASNADMVLEPLGTGVLQFGAATASAATASTHKIAMKAADGTTYYLLVTNV